jgi:hypothetical protein
MRIFHSGLFLLLSMRWRVEGKRLRLGEATGRILLELEAEALSPAP